MRDPAERQDAVAEIKYELDQIGPDPQRKVLQPHPEGVATDPHPQGVVERRRRARPMVAIGPVVPVASSSR